MRAGLALELNAKRSKVVFQRSRVDLWDVILRLTQALLRLGFCNALQERVDCRAGFSQAR